MADPVVDKVPTTGGPVKFLAIHGHDPLVYPETLSMTVDVTGLSSTSGVYHLETIDGKRRYRWVAS